MPAKAKPADNLALWNELNQTEKEYTKQFNKKGFKGTAISPAYVTLKLTEKFGPCGKGWGFVIDQEEYRPGRVLEVHKTGDWAEVDRETIHVVRGHLWYILNGERYETSPQFGQTTFVGKYSTGVYTDEEAPKKSISDCISKCAVLLGVAADIHLGLWDDNKYVNTPKPAGKSGTKSASNNKSAGSKDTSPAKAEAESKPATLPRGRTKWNSEQWIEFVAEVPDGATLNAALVDAVKKGIKDEAFCKAVAQKARAVCKKNTKSWDNIVKTLKGLKEG